MRRFSLTQVIINFAQFYDEKEKDDDEDAFEVMHQNRDDAHFAIVVERRRRNVLIGPSLQGGKTTADDVISFQERKGHYYVNVVKLFVSTSLLSLYEFTVFL